MNPKLLLGFGVVLTALGIAGFFTVADDLRHTGELIGVGAVVILGISVVAVSFRKHKT